MSEGDLVGRPSSFNDAPLPLFPERSAPDLEIKGLIIIEGQGANKKYVVKRNIPGVGNVRVVALRLKPGPVAMPRKRFVLR